ncbi:hypothetical protein NL108_004610 [Boleophthalmus pectinirostris]|nr:uncharacterized protein LOC110175499 isoform X2 [Boleophthalmus pectinirostris]XP_020797349.1 uncharacterized protein LOC110175499 isoform X2 [Boleophthalmus pectinirostris]KAJ0056328.1 hypothetical protein NL108_004610 [Boleophthalmus pectinirostris]
MTLRPVVVLALAVLVPVLCMDMKKRCGLRDQVRASQFPRRVWENNLATVICEVEKFVNHSLMNPPMPPPTFAPCNFSTPALNSTSAPCTPSPPPPSTTIPPPPPTASESSSEEDSSEEGRGRDGVGKYLRRCVVVINGTNVKVDGACLGMNKVFVKIFLNAGEECKKIDPALFFRDCRNPGPPKPNSGPDNSDSDEDRPKFKPKFGWAPKPGKKPRH